MTKQTDLHRMFLPGAVISLRITDAWHMPLENMVLEYTEDGNFLLSGSDGPAVSVPEEWVAELVELMEQNCVPVFMFGNETACLDGVTKELTLCRDRENRTVYRWHTAFAREPLEKIADLLVEKYHTAVKTE